MTDNEAIKAMKFYKEKLYNGIFNQFIGAFDIAISALEKQIPKKPVKKNPICYSKTKDGQELYAYDYHCPMCDTKLKINEHHCPCGQALDWRDTE